MIFTCGLGDTSNKDNIDDIQKELKKVFSETMMYKIKVFYLRGGIDYSILNFKHKSMMAILNKFLKSKDFNSLNDEKKKMIENYGKKVDFIDLDTITPIIQYTNPL